MAKKGNIFKIYVEQNDVKIGRIEIYDKNNLLRKQKKSYKSLKYFAVVAKYINENKT